MNHTVASTIPAGTSPVFLVPATPLTLPLLKGLFRRSSPDAVRRRFHGPAGPWLDRELQRTVTWDPCRTSLVAVAGGKARGLGTLAVGRDGRAEVAFLVEDGWQRHGVGRDLARALGRRATADGFDELLALVQPDNRAALRFFERLAPHGTRRLVDGTVEITIPLRRPAATAAPQVAQPPCAPAEAA